MDALFIWQAFATACNLAVGGWLFFARKGTARVLALLFLFWGLQGAVARALYFLKGPEWKALFVVLFLAYPLAAYVPLAFGRVANARRQWWLVGTSAAGAVVVSVLTFLLPCAWECDHSWIPYGWTNPLTSIVTPTLDAFVAWHLLREPAPLGRAGATAGIVLSLLCVRNAGLVLASGFVYGISSFVEFFADSIWLLAGAAGTWFLVHEVDNEVRPGRGRAHPYVLGVLYWTAFFVGIGRIAGTHKAWAYAYTGLALGALIAAFLAMKYPEPALRPLPDPAPTHAERLAA